MRHVTYAEKSELVGDAAAGLLMEYATVLGRAGGTDHVTGNAVGPDGNDSELTLLLNLAAVLAVETVRTSTDEPDNSAAIRYINDRITELSAPQYVEPNTAGNSDVTLQPADEQTAAHPTGTALLLGAGQNSSVLPRRMPVLLERVRQRRLRLTHTGVDEDVAIFG